MNYFITAIGTDSGKTLVSAIVATAIQGEYWKPVQAGYPTDTDTIKKLTAGSIKCHKEQFVLNTPASPHYAAEVDDVVINMNDFVLPDSKKDLVIEGAGGTLVPLNNKNFVIDLVPQLKASIILVSNHYLGSINHTMLSLELIKQRGYPLKGIIFNGPPNPSTEKIILQHTEAPCLLSIPQLESLNSGTINNYAQLLSHKLDELD